MKIRGLLRNLSQRIIDLIIIDDLFLRSVFQRDPASLSKWHRPIAVERAARIHTHSQRGNLKILLPAAAKEIAHRALY